MTSNLLESAGRFFGVCKPSGHFPGLFGDRQAYQFQLPCIEANSLRSASATTSCGASTPDLTSSTVTPAATPPVAPVEASQHYVAWLKNINLPDLIDRFFRSEMVQPSRMIMFETYPLIFLICTFRIHTSSRAQKPAIYRCVKDQIIWYFSIIKSGLQHFFDSQAEVTWGVQLRTAVAAQNAECCNSTNAYVKQVTSKACGDSYIDIDLFHDRYQTR